MSAPPDRPRVLLALPDARERLRILAALGDRYDLQPLGPGEDPLRAVRSARPALLLLAVPRARTAVTLRACRAIKTDAGTPPLVALVDPQARLLDPLAAMESSLADGYLGQELPDAELRDFVAQLLAGRRPLRAGASAPRGLLARLLGR